MEQFFDAVESETQFLDGFVHSVTSDILDHSEFWAEEQEDFLARFRAAASTPEGREFILFLVGWDKMNTYLNEVGEYIGMNTVAEEDSEDE